jgi:hypothetical protein
MLAACHDSSSKLQKDDAAFLMYHGIAYSFLLVTAEQA